MTGAAIAPLDLAVIALTVVGVLIVGLLAGRGQTSAADYFLGKRNKPWWAVACSQLATQASDASFIGGAGLAYAYGVNAGIFNFTIGVFLPLVGLLLIPVLYRMGIVTLPSYFARRFDAKTRALKAVLFLFYRGGALGIYLYIPAVSLAAVYPLRLLGLSPLMTYLIVFAGVAGLYATWGGLSSVIWTDVVQYLVMLAGVAVLLPLTLGAVGGFDSLLQALPAGHRDFFKWNADPASAAWPFWPLLLGGFIVQAGYFGAEQTEVQRTLSARSLRDARIACSAAAMMAGLEVVLWIIPGLAGSVLYPGLQSQDQVLVTMMAALIPTGLQGLFIAALIMAVMSSFESYLNSISAVVITDVVQPLSQRLAGKQLSDRQWLRVSRYLTGVLLVVAVLMGPLTQALGGVMIAINRITSVAYGPILAGLLLGLFVARVGGDGAFWGMLSGLLVAALVVFGEFIPAGWTAALPVALGSSLRSLFEVHWLYAGIIGFAITVGVALAVEATGAVRHGRKPAAVEPPSGGEGVWRHGLVRLLAIGDEGRPWFQSSAMLAMLAILWNIAWAWAFQAWIFA
ncbi:MAG: sodium/solute symporter [Acidobacteriota bacterium]